MIIQRLSIRAATGKLKVIAVWRCLQKNGAKVCRWRMDVDHKAGLESMTVDVVGCGPLSRVDVAASLGEEPLSMTITPLNLTVLSNPGAVHAGGNEDPSEAADSLRSTRLYPRLTLVSNTSPPNSTA